MKLIFTSLCLVFIQVLTAQISDRVYIAGEIIVPANGEVSQIEIINKNTNKGTVTNQYGQFGISVKLGDRLRFEAIQYQNFTVVIDENIVKKKKLTIKINDEVNTLDEVIVSPYDLEGNIEVDARKVNATYFKAPGDGSKSILNDYEGTQPNIRTQTINESLNTEQQFIRNGLNVANIFRTILASKEVTVDHKLPENVDVMVRKIYKDSFFKENLNIDKDKINQFIFYVEDKGLSKVMLKKGNELDLIEFLIQKSKEFKIKD
jgi:uncharacterized protein YqkB